LSNRLSTQQPYKNKISDRNLAPQLSNFFRSYKSKLLNFEDAFIGIPENDFSILAAHTPEIFKAAAGFGPKICLCGHTHAGQVQIPGMRLSD